MMDMEMNRQMAEDVMGWLINKRNGNPAYYDNGNFVMYVEDWNPSENVNQALIPLMDFIKVGRIENLEITFDEKWIVCLTFYDDFFDDYQVLETSDILAEAICLAVIEANEKIKEYNDTKTM